MASKRKQYYQLIDNEASLDKALEELKKHRTEEKGFLAVDCEGVQLSRKGELTIVTVATKEQAYIFDVVKLGKAAFTSGLGEILEDKTQEKLTFDCREDSDALWHQFHVKLDGVLDLQLLDVMHRRERGRSTPGTFERVNGYKRCLEIHTSNMRARDVKERGTRILTTDREVWKKRPLPKLLLEYCMVDTIAMFELYEKMKIILNKETTRILMAASQRYLDHFRGKAVRTYDRYERNAYLPSGIIVESDSASGASSSGYKRPLSHEEECSEIKRKK